MTVADHQFCRTLLADTMKDIRLVATPEQIKAAWAWLTIDTYEFHGPDNFYVVTKGDCLWSAKADGWEQWLTHRVRIEEEELEKRCPHCGEEDCESEECTCENCGFLIAACDCKKGEDT